MSTPREQLAELLKKSREDAGHGTQTAFARHAHLSRSVISRAENPDQPAPTPEVLEAYAEYTNADLPDLEDLVKRANSGTPEWFIPYKHAEAEATMIRCWGPMIAPGLTQVEPYAREVISADPVTPAELDDKVAARMERQKVLERAYVVVILGPVVLTQCMGSPAIMAEECDYLAELAERPNIAVHVVPDHVNHGAYGGIDIASRDGLCTVSFSTGTDDVTTTASDRADRAVRAIERILGHAMPVAASLEYLQAKGNEWKEQI